MHTSTVPAEGKKQQEEPRPFTIEIKLPDDIGCSDQPKLIEHRVRIGQEAWTRLTSCQSWSDWLLVGEALLVGRAEAMRSAHTNKPKGRRYNEEFSHWLKANKYDGIDKSTRSRLLECLERRTEIETWRATLATSDRLKLNYPTAVLRRWKKTFTKKPDDPAPKISHIAKLKESIVTLEEQNARLKCEVELSSPFTRKDTAHDIADFVFRTISPSKVREVAKELNRLARSIKQQDDIEIGPTMIDRISWEDERAA